MTMLCFQTPTIIDEAFIFTMGASVKTNDSPIGYFGTGLKYAIAITMRLKGKMTIYTPNVKYRFYTKTETLRGTPVEMVYCAREDGLGETKIRCPMTTEYGKNWEPWMALRELYSNTIDEKGEMYEDLPIFPELGDFTIITVDCDEIYDAWLQRDRYFINPKRQPIYSNDLMDIYLGSNDAFFYRGVRVSKEKMSLGLTYNVKVENQNALTEDRTMSEFYLDYYLRPTFVKSPKNSFTEIFLQRLINPNSYEATINANHYTYKEFDADNLEALCEAYRLHPDKLPSSWSNIVSNYYANTDIEKLYPHAMLLCSDEERLAECLTFLKDKGFRFDNMKLHFTEAMPNSHHGSAMLNEQRIILNLGTTLRHENWHPETCKTLIEEYIHIKHRVPDESRQMQEKYNEYLYSLMHYGRIP